MTLSREEIEFLKAHLEQNRKQGSKKRYQTCDPVTSESEVLVVRSRTTGDASYHAYSDGRPACGMGPGKTFRSMDPETAAQWHDPCQWCYPEDREQ